MKLLERIKKYWAMCNHDFGIKARRWEDYRSNQNPNDAIWFFGCSHVEGVSLSKEETAPKRLSMLMNANVINYGVSGSGPMMVDLQLDRLLKKYNPKAIVIAWPSFLRWQTHNDRIFPVLWSPACLDGKTSHFHNDHFGCKNLWPNYWEEYVDMATSGKLEKINYEIVKKVREKIKGIICVEFEYSPDCSYEKLPAPCFPWRDLAPDGFHPGPITQDLVAKWVHNQLLEKSAHEI